MHARIAADALDRLVREVQTGRAEWTHPHTARQAVEDLTRLAAATATALHQLAAAFATLAPGTTTPAAITTLHQAGQHTTTAATHLRQARRAL
ncbi:hypothetical protein [Streptomyces triticirhizae]|uniref:Uncharacterized protein n=1 Tax=Streptomyces triticirhizae TaxID=2483353 RepID=A0A3M2LRM3_9ACTN|nr:hypothetical protein [Streptomyces triticirhizae]RMI39736.1 hypothetical protein EBN88_14185 [Streptomyces triticirhizae]